MAAGQRGSLRGAIFHSDHGSVYTSSVFQETCRQLGVQQSMGAVGSSADNALAESFNATLKREVLRDAKVFPNMLSCRRQVFAWCARYNTKRLHTWCNYQAPTPSNTARQLHSTLQHKHHTHVHFLGAGPVISINK